MRVKLILFALIAFMVVGIAAGGLGIIARESDLIITYSAQEKNELSKGMAVNDLNGIDYFITCDNNINCVATVNKVIYDNNKCVVEVGKTLCGKAVIGYVFQDYKINFSAAQTCLSEENQCVEWSEGVCLEYDEKTGECIKWEKKPECLKWELVCTIWTNKSKDDFARDAISKELLRIGAIQTARKDLNAPTKELTGKVFIR
jgi:hypothetical protein